MHQSSFENDRWIQATIDEAGSMAPNNDLITTEQEQDGIFIPAPSTPIRNNMELESSRLFSRRDSPLFIGDDRQHIASPRLLTSESSDTRHLSPFGHSQSYPHHSNASFGGTSVSSFDLSHHNSPSFTPERYHQGSRIHPQNRYQPHQVDYGQVYSPTTSSIQPIDQQLNIDPRLEQEPVETRNMLAESGQSLFSFVGGGLGEAFNQPAKIPLKLPLEPLLRTIRREPRSEGPSVSPQFISSASSFLRDGNLSEYPPLDPPGDPLATMFSNNFNQYDEGLPRLPLQRPAHLPGQTDAIGAPRTNIGRLEDIGHRLPVPRAKSQKSNKSSGSRVECPDCGKSLSKSSLPKHRRLHKEERIECLEPNCNFKTTSKRDFNRHDTAVHRGQQSYVCHICGRPFGRNDNLARHRNSIHTVNIDGAN